VASRQDLCDCERDQLGAADRRASARTAPGGQEGVHQHGKCAERVVEVGAREATSGVDVACSSNADRRRPLLSSWPGHRGRHQFGIGHRAARRSSGSFARARPPAATRPSSPAGRARRAARRGADMPRAAPANWSAAPSGFPPGGRRGQEGAAWYGGGVSPATSPSPPCAALGAGTGWRGLGRREASAAADPSGLDLAAACGRHRPAPRE